MHCTANHSSKGFALASAMLIVILLAGISVGTMYVVNMESRLGATDLENTQGFYAAEAAMEKMISDLNALYASVLAPTVTDIEGLSDSSYQPAISSTTYPQYQFIVPNVGGEPTVEVRSISSGPNQGLLAYITPLTLAVTARGTSGTEVKMEREVQMALIPVFQFGLFSETDLAYNPGAGFDFGGRVHTNGNLFLWTGSGVTFHSKITAFGEVIRAETSNGLSSVGYTGTVLIPTAPGGCDDAQPACRHLEINEGSKVAGPTSADNTDWPNISLTTYNGFILNGDTGAKPMTLPFVAPGLRAVEMIRRHPAGEDPNSLIGRSRLYNMAQIRVLISDDPTENPGGAGVRLANVAPYYTGGTYGATDTAFAEANTAVDSDHFQPPGVTPITCVSGDEDVDEVEGGANTCWPLIDDYLLVQSKQADGSYADVTMEWLNLGIARENPDAILKFQQLKDTNSPPDGTPNFPTADLDVPWRSLHLGLYDTREGEVRDVSGGSSSTSCAIGGIMNIVELDVGNLRRWLKGLTGSTGTSTESVTQNGYLFYFSDRRGMLPNPDGDKVGEYGFEDIINPPDENGVPDGIFAAAEDVNQNGVLETYGAANLGDAFGVANGDPTIVIDCKDKGRKNAVTGARHGLELVNGSLGNLPTRPDGSGGFTVASENIVYVKGNYNADDAGYGDPHASAAVIADAASFLSKNWQDWHSWVHPTYVDSSPATL
ncbi:MAG: pilus assembly PilX N-terminal domain-containing protein, partial [Acidobacteriota bacterium]